MAIPFVDVHPQAIALTLAVCSVPEAVTQAVVVILNQSQGGMCICRVLGIGAGVSRECFGP